MIDWQAFSDKWSPQFASTTGRPALPTRLMAALPYLKHTFALSDEDVVERWCEKPYWQHFSGERYFRHDLPCDPSSLVRWRQRIGEEGCEWLLAQSIDAAKNAGLMKCRSLDALVLDTTVQPKAIAHPTDIGGLFTAACQADIACPRNLQKEKCDNDCTLLIQHYIETYIGYMNDYRRTMQTAPN